MMRSTDQFQAALASSGGNCVEVRFDGGEVGVRNSRYPERVVTVSHREWRELVVKAIDTHQLDIRQWFPVERYGDFADTFQPNEIDAFRKGILNGDSRVTASP